MKRLLPTESQLAEAGRGQLYLRDEELRGAAELIMMAERTLTMVTEAALPKMSKGKISTTHCWILGRIALHQPVATATLIPIFGMSKQTASRIVTELVLAGLVKQYPSPMDRRQRMLTLTEAGNAYEQRLWQQQRALITKAYRTAGGMAVEGFRKVLSCMLEEKSNSLKVKMAFNKD